MGVKDSENRQSGRVKGSENRQSGRVKGSENRQIRVITKLPNSEQFYKEKVKTHKYINSQNQSTTGKL